MTAWYAAQPRAARIGWLVLIAAAAGLVAAVNLYLAGRSIGLIIGGEPAVDWEQYVEAARRLRTGGDLYEIAHDYVSRYSPLFAAFFGLIAPIGLVAWRLLHVVAALALPSWPMRLIVLVSWPFWYDVQTGNLLTFVFLAAAWAVRGNRLAIGIYLLLVILGPRPLMLPVAAWLLWQRPEWRWPFAAALVAHAAAVFGLGWAEGWIGSLVAATDDASLPSNVGPSRFLGTIPWLVVGLPLAAWLTWRGRVGWASLAASPYWFPYYLLFAALEADRIRWPFWTSRR
jgi:hypothetical protein